MKLIAINVMFG